MIIMKTNIWIIILLLLCLFSLTAIADISASDYRLEIQYTAAGTIDSKTYYHLNSDGKIDYIECFSSEEALLYHIQYEYNDIGQLIKKQKVHSSGITDYISYYYYNAFDKIDHIIKEQVMDINPVYGEAQLMVVKLFYQYYYNPNRHLVSIRKYLDQEDLGDVSLSDLGLEDSFFRQIDLEQKDFIYDSSSIRLKQIKRYKNQGNGLQLAEIKVYYYHYEWNTDLVVWYNPDHSPFQMEIISYDLDGSLQQKEIYSIESLNPCEIFSLSSFQTDFNSYLIKKIVYREE